MYIVKHFFLSIGRLFLHTLYQPKADNTMKEVNVFFDPLSSMIQYVSSIVFTRQ